MALKGFRIILLVVLSAAALALWAKYLLDNKRLFAFSQKYVAAWDTPAEKVVKLTEMIRHNVRTKRNPGYLGLPVFRFMRATPCQVTESGGDCSDKARLLIAMLRLHGVRASKVALYDDKGKPRHAIVEAHIGNGEKMAVDAIYGMYFPKPDGGFYSVSDISNDEQLLRQRVKALAAKDTKRPYLATYPFHKYIYRQPRSINWDKSIFTRWMYRTLHGLIGERVNKLERPYLVERPALMLLCGILAMISMIALSGLPIWPLKQLNAEITILKR